MENNETRVFMKKLEFEVLFWFMVESLAMSNSVMKKKLSKISSRVQTCRVLF
jgi:hypothetical protein